MKTKRLILGYICLAFISQLFIAGVHTRISAQAQGPGFSANDESCNSFQCIDDDGKSTPASYDSNKDICVCSATGEQATIRPPKLQQIEIWFVRVIYVIWALVGSLSFLFLVSLGYQYMLTKGDVTKITAIRQRVINYVIGLVLVFAALPILTTFFRVLGVNGQVQCYQFDTLPRFQFFFPELCTDPKLILVNDPCNLDDADGFACAVEGERSEGCQVGGTSIYYECINLIWDKKVQI